MGELPPPFLKTRFLTPGTLRPWALAVAVAAGLAHGGCLGSVFYLDDWTQIVECDAVGQGAWYS